jgi:hypothetical protein
VPFEDLKLVMGTLTEEVHGSRNDVIQSSIGESVVCDRMSETFAELIRHNIVKSIDTKSIVLIVSYLRIGPVRKEYAKFLSSASNSS